MWFPQGRGVSFQSNRLMNNKLSVGELDAILSNDIIERSSDTFVFQGADGRIGWEKSLPEGAAYSEYLLSVKTVKEALSNAYRHASDMLIAMDLPKKVTIEVSHTEDSGWTDNKMVCLSTKFFDNPGLTVGQKMDIFTGLAVHEGSHILYTNFAPKQGFSKLALALDNLIEDERIENRLGHEKPGLANFLKMTKWYFFGEYCSSIRGGEKPDARQEEATRLVNAVIKLIRYPGALAEDDKKDFADALAEVHDALMPYPTTSSDVAKKALEVEAILKKYIQFPPQQDAGGSSGESGDNDRSSGKGGGKQDGDGQDGTSGNDADPGSGKEDGQGSDRSEKNGSSGRDAGRNDGSGQSTMSDKELNDILNKIADGLKVIAKGANESLSEQDECQNVRQDDSLNKFLSGKYSSTGVKGTVFEQIPFDEIMLQVYLNDLAVVRPFIPAMRNALRSNAVEQKLTLSGMRNGILDTGKLAIGFQGVQTIYKQYQTVKADPVTVCLLIDESGSMFGEKAEKARQTAILINEALKGIPGVDLYVYGYTEEFGINSKLLLVYKEQGHGPRFGLSAITGRGGTPTSEAIEASAKRIRQSTSSDCLMFVITDGYAGSKKPVGQVVKQISADNFSVVGIGIENDLDMSRDFPEFISLTDLRALPKDLGKLVKKAILKTSQRKVV